MCGEKRNGGAELAVAKGSPPRVRGKGGFRTESWNDAGITPACAGKSDSGLQSCSLLRDHPRVCGEKSYCSILARNSLGSPPRVRGKVKIWLLANAFDRITPACAGKRRTKRRCPALARDHPRVCGEKKGNSGRNQEDRGSPPRVRGKAATLPMTNTALGITPACAGKSLQNL